MDDPTRGMNMTTCLRKFNSMLCLFLAYAIVPPTVALTAEQMTSQPISSPRAATVHGVITRAGKPAKDRRIFINGQETRTNKDGYFRFDNIPVGNQTVHIRTGVSSSRRQFPDVQVIAPETISHYDIEPYYAADVFSIDWRLHQDWNNGFDDPFNLSSTRSLKTNTHTFSGYLLKPVYAAATVAEIAWTLPGLVIGAAAYQAPRVVGGEPNVNYLTKTLLAGYLPLEAVAKAVEVPVKTVFWPIDRLTGSRARQELNATRESVMRKN